MADARARIGGACSRPTLLGGCRASPDCSSTRVLHSPTSRARERQPNRHALCSHREEPRVPMTASQRWVGAC